jgi:hypothetical protein
MAREPNQPHGHEHGHGGESNPIPESVPAPPAATAAAPGVNEAVVPSVKDGAKVMLQGGVARVDYIRARYKQGIGRGQILKEVNERRLSGTNPVSYQIVFSATKGLPKPATGPAAAPVDPLSIAPKDPVPGAMAAGETSAAAA